MPPKILIVEPDEILRGLFVNKLIQEGYEVLEARDEEEGLWKLHIQTPDLLIVDLDLPKLGGRGFLEMIHSDPLLRGIPVIALVNTPAEDSYDLGVNYVFVKTEFNPQEVIDKVQELIGSNY